MPWAKGQSGNPGGKLRGHLELIRAARDQSPMALATLVNVAKDAKAPHNARVTAACALLDRAWGKPKEHVTIEGEVALAVIGIDRPPEIQETREEWIARRRAELVTLDLPAASIPDANAKAK